MSSQSTSTTLGEIRIFSCDFGTFESCFHDTTEARHTTSAVDLLLERPLWTPHAELSLSSANLWPNHLLTHMQNFIEAGDLKVNEIKVEAR